MKRRDFVVLVFAGALFAVLTTPASLFAQQGKHHRYKLLDLGTFGGRRSYVNVPISYAQVLNNRGTVAGWADTATPDPNPDFCFDADCFVAHAFRSRNGVRKDLGALPGGASSQANWISANGLIAGISQNGEIDPLVPPFPEFRAVLWREGEITDLGTLDGGYESIANAVNSRGQVVGFATNTIPDPDSLFGLGYQTRAFLWQDGVMQDLGTLGTGTDAVALLVNEGGQIAGISYTSSEPSEVCAQAEVGSLTSGAFLWENGAMKNLGNFGGSCTFASDLNNNGQVVGGSFLTGDQASHPFLWNGSKLIDLGTFGGSFGNAVALNDHGEVVGGANYPGDQVLHAALWRHGKIKDLGTLTGDSASFAFTINASGQVVGVSVPPGGDFDSAHAFLWENGGPMVDLESLIPGGSSLRLTKPETINDRGEIAGNGFDADGNQHAFLLVPCDENRTGTEACGDVTAGPAFRPVPAITKLLGDRNNVVRRMLRHRLPPLPTIFTTSTSSEPSASSASGTLAAEDGTAETGDSLPSSLDLLGADPISRFGTASSCTLPGRPCSPNSGPRCCGAYHCVFSGGSTRVGYACK